MSKLTRSYYSKINSILKKIIKEEEDKFVQCAKLISKSYKKGGQLYIFGTGHSRLLGEESFHRAGGYAAACPVRDSDTNFKKGSRKASELERTPNIARKAIARYKITNKDILMIVSNSGVNYAPVEAALIAKEKKIKTISLTSIKYSKQAPLSKLNKRLFEITDIFIDNKIQPGDAIINIKNKMVGPASTLTGSFILNSILIEVANILKNEKLFPFYISFNMPNAKKNNEKLEKKFSKVNPHL